MGKGKVDYSKTIIHLQNVTKHYHMGDNIVKAVDGISIDIKRGILFLNICNSFFKLFIQHRNYYK